MQLFWISPLDSAQTMKLQFHWASRRTEPHVVTKSYIPSSTDIHAETCLSFFNKKFFFFPRTKIKVKSPFLRKIKINKYPSKINSIMCIILSLSLSLSLSLFSQNFFKSITFNIWPRLILIWWMSSHILHSNQFQSLYLTKSSGETLHFRIFHILYVETPKMLFLLFISC